MPRRPRIVAATRSPATNPYRAADWTTGYQGFSTTLPTPLRAATWPTVSSLAGSFGSERFGRLGIIVDLNVR